MPITLDPFSRFDTTPSCERHTDGQCSWGLRLVSCSAMSVFRRLNWRRSASLQRRAWCMGSFLCRDVDELVYADVRHRLQRAGSGVQTTVKLSAKVRIHATAPIASRTPPLLTASQRRHDSST